MGADKGLLITGLITRRSRDPLFVTRLRCSAFVQARQFAIDRLCGLARPCKGGVSVTSYDTGVSLVLVTLTVFYITNIIRLSLKAQEARATGRKEHQGGVFSSICCMPSMSSLMNTSILGTSKSSGGRPGVNLKRPDFSPSTEKKASFSFLPL